MSEQVPSLNSPGEEPLKPADSRPGKAGDLSCILAILDAWPTHFVEAAKGLVRDAFAKHRTIVWQTQATVVGFVTWRAADKEMELLWMAVDPKWNRKGIGSALVRSVMATAKTHTRIFLRTATTDSVVAGTSFDGKAYEATNRFFQRFGFEDETIERDYWGPSNHSLVMSRPLDPLNPLLARLAPFVRRLQKEIGRAFNVNDAYVAIAFRHDTQCAVFFAEFVPPATASQPPGDTNQYVRDEYVLPRTMKFVQLVLDSTETAPCYEVEEPGNTEVDGDMRSRWGHETKQVHVFRIPLPADALQSQCDAVLYFATRYALGTELQLHLSKSRSLVSQVLRTALFLGAAAPHDVDETELDELAEKLAQKLPRFDEYERQFQTVLGGLRNPTAWFTHRFAAAQAPTVNESDDAAKPSPPEEQVLKAIRNAVEITVRGKPEGSFQGKTMRFVTIKPRDPHGVKHAAAYDAVVKEVDRDKAQKEQSGYQLAQFYFEDISFALPPAAILWPVEDDRHDKKSRFTSVIPRVSGQTLTRYIRERWHTFQAATESTGDHFGRIYRTLVAFTRGLGQGVVQEPAEVPHQCLYDSHLGDSTNAKRRIPKTLEALRFYLDAFSDAPYLTFPLSGGAAEVLNPLWLLQKVGRERINHDDQNFWLNTTAVPVNRVDFCHGDFHSGNMLVREDGTVTVLDYDYVGRDRQFSDIATLEASFLLSLSLAEVFKEQSQWLAVFPSLLTGLAEQEALGAVPRDILRNPDAFNAWRVVQTGRVWVANENAFDENAFPVYRALVVSALLRLFASNHGFQHDKRRYHAGLFATATFYLGKLLKKMVKPPSGPTTTHFGM